VRRLTYDRLVQAARELELSIGELADRWLSDCLNTLDEAGEEDPNGNGEDDEPERCEGCGEPVDSDFRFCPTCGVEFESE